jgi:hypothetical protein
MVASSKGLGPEKAKASSIYKRQTRPLVREVAKQIPSTVTPTHDNILVHINKPCVYYYIFFAENLLNF